MRHKILAYLGAFDRLRPHREDKVTSDTQIKYATEMPLEDLDLVYWGYIKNQFSSSNVEYLGDFTSVAEIEALEGADGDFAILVHAGGFSMYIIIEDEWQRVGPLYLEGLKVVKRPSNNNNNKIEYNDFAEGWITNNIFVSGFFKGTDSTQSQISNENNWNGTTKF